MSIQTAYYLMRFDKPIGIALLWWPTAWALWISHKGMPPLFILSLFFLGTVLMRAAGCVMNDIADRHIDRHVSRTRDRPLTSGKMQLKEALRWFLLLCLLAFIILLQLPSKCFGYALLAVVLTIGYPFCKRFFPMPQTVLSLAFSMGMPMAYVASEKPFDAYLGWIILLNFFWVLAYDTIYACVDKEDDAKIGVHSTALFWGSYAKSLVMLLLMGVHVGWLSMLLSIQVCWLSVLFWLLAGMNVYQQIRYLRSESPQHWFQAFKLNGWYGFWLWMTLVPHAPY